jgi:hypothetical protein
MANSAHKIVVFDLDETLGNFVELGMFCDALEKTTGEKISQEHFFQLMDLFSEFLRPNILRILSFLMDKKRRKCCAKIMIYTNNKGPKSWTKRIAEYFNHKLGSEVFDDIIAAFKVRGKIVEICRTSHEKSVSDLLRCTRIPRHTQICFLDDQFHPLMEHSDVYYINVKPYTYSLPFREMAERYYNTYPDDIPISMSEDVFVSSIVRHMKLYNYVVVPKTDSELRVDNVIGKKIIHHLELFFKTRKISKTRRFRRVSHRKTKKNNR